MTTRPAAIREFGSIAASNIGHAAEMLRRARQSDEVPSGRERPIALLAAARAHAIAEGYLSNAIDALREMTGDVKDDESALGAGR